MTNPIGFGEHFKPRFHPGRLDIPLHWRKPRRVFVCFIDIDALEARERDAAGRFIQTRELPVIP